MGYIQAMPESIEAVKRQLLLEKVELHNFGPLTRLDWPNLGLINLVIGGSGSGKTFLLKAAVQKG